MAHRLVCPRAGLNFVLGIGLLVSWPLSCGQRALGSEARNTPTVKLVKQARPSIVNIHGQKTLSPADDGYRRGDGPQNVNGMGTGVVIDERGYILTNHHVVDGVKEIQVTLSDEKTHTATLVARDSKTDLAIVKVAVSRKLPVINIGASDDLMVGEPVVAVGNAYGYAHTVTCGVISELHRAVQVSDTQKYRDLIQTDASINPGNSGGPLLNADGEMIGINVAVRAHAQGIGFAIPVDMAMAVAAELMGVERVTKTNAWHGIISKSLAIDSSRLLVVGEMDQDSPAAKCGLQPGDILTAVANSSVARALDIERALLGRKPGEEIQVTVERKRKPVNVNLVLASAPKQRAKESDRVWEVLGLRLETLSPKQFEELHTHYHGGLLVSAVRAGSPAFRQGIRSGDILVGMHVWETVTLESVEYVLKRPDFASIEPLKFYILRDEGDSFATYYGHMSVSVRR